jgi:hypothetical protein
MKTAIDVGSGLVNDFLDGAPLGVHGEADNFI